jgi:hypothetical protein
MTYAWSTYTRRASPLQNIDALCIHGTPPEDAEALVYGVALCIDCLSVVL